VIDLEEAELAEYVAALLAFDRRELMRLMVDNEESDGFLLAAAAAGAFVTILRLHPELVESRADRIALYRSISRSGVFTPALPLWMIEGAFQGASGMSQSIEGIPSDVLIEIHVLAARELSGRLTDAVRIQPDALRMAKRVYERLH
jgi:hypothetical protein